VKTIVARFAIGQVIRHRLFHYRGVIIDIDPQYCGSEEWYERMAPSHPPKDRPWYKVLVHAAGTRSYVAERNLAVDDSGDPVNHPEIETHFLDFDAGVYRQRDRGN